MYFLLSSAEYRYNIAHRSSLFPLGYYFLEDPKGQLSQIRTVPTGLKFNVRLLRSSSGKTFFSVVSHPRLWK